MSLRHLIGGGFIAGLLLAGFHNNALASTFSNGDFVTHEQAEWGDVPTPTNAAWLLQENYDDVYASTAGAFEIGIQDTNGFSMLFTDYPELLSYLPVAGTAGPLNANLVNPTLTPSGAFGGEVAALKLNIDFSDVGLLPQNVGIPFGDLVLKNLPNEHIGLPQLNGLTVRQFSAVVNTVLGGGFYGTYSISNLDSIAADINASFVNGIVSSFATTNLALPSNILVIQTVSRARSALTFTWNTIPDQRYQVQSSPNLNQTNWTSLGGILTATNTTTSATETSTNAQMFYRIQLLP
jgi:hypothetical protein